MYCFFGQRNELYSMYNKVVTKKCYYKMTISNALNGTGRKCTWTGSGCPVCLTAEKNMGAQPARAPTYR